MPCTPRNQTNKLRINIDPDHCYQPGDTISGTVSRRVFTTSRRATVRITLLGRVKVKDSIIAEFPRSATGAPNRYCGQFDIIDPSAHTQVLFDDKLVIYSATSDTRVVDEEDAAHWPFSLRLPTHCCPRPLDRYQQPSSSINKLMYLPYHQAACTSTPLPPDFHMSHDVGFVEYCLKATMQWSPADDSQISHPDFDAQHAEALCQIHVQPAHPGGRITGFDHFRCGSTHSMCTYLLQPSAVKKGHTFSQMRREMVGSSKVPRLRGQLQLDIPRVVQLGRKGQEPLDVPMHIRFLPLFEGTNIPLDNIEAKFELTFMSVILSSNTEIASVHPEAPFGRVNSTEDVGGRIWPPPGKPDIKKLKESERIYIPCSTRHMVDVSRKVGFDSSAWDGIIQDFTTFNMKHEHQVYVSIKVEAVETEMALLGHTKVRLIPPPPPPRAPPRKESGMTRTPEPAAGEASGTTSRERSEAWIQPPREEDPPPTFEEVMRLDREAGVRRD